MEARELCCIGRRVLMRLVVYLSQCDVLDDLRGCSHFANQVIFLWFLRLQRCLLLVLLEACVSLSYDPLDFRELACPLRDTHRAQQGIESINIWEFCLRSRSYTWRARK